MSTTLVLPESIASVLTEFAKLHVETGAVLLARPMRSDNGDLRLLAVQLRPVPENAYVRREAQELLIRSDGYVPALREAAESSTVPIWLHTHPGNGCSPRASRHDHHVDRQLSDLFRLRSGSEFYGALVIAHREGQLRFTGHLDGERIVLIDRLLTVGPRFSLQWNAEAPSEPLPALFDRSIRAFGGEIQRVLGDLRIAVVGCGGTGSSVAEQLVRLGVRHLTVVDPDDLSDSNLTHVYGSTAADVGRRKVDVVADHLLRIAPDAHIERVAAMITTEGTARTLIGMDIVFGCTDDNAGRLVLSRFATYMLTPVIDCGVVLTSDDNGHLDGIHGRVTVLYPGVACLVCRNRVDLARAGSEMLTPEERVRRVDEGYAPALGGTEPAVVAYTTLVSATAVSELLERLICYGPLPVPSEIILRLHDREVSTNEQAPRQRHYCHPSVGKLGLSATVPFLEQTWQA